MGWAKMDDQRAMNRKMREAGFEARGLDEAAIEQVAHDMTDGFIAEGTVEMLAVAHRCRHWRRLVAVLVKVGRWEPVDGGWMLHDYLEYNPTKAEWEAEKAKKRNAGRRGGQASARARASASARANGQAPSSSKCSSRPDPTRPELLTSPPPLTVVGGERPEEGIIDEVVRLVAERQLAAARNVQNPAAWLYTAKQSIRDEWSPWIAESSLSVEAMVDHICPPPKPEGRRDYEHHEPKCLTCNDKPLAYDVDEHGNAVPCPDCQAKESA